MAGEGAIKEIEQVQKRARSSARAKAAAQHHPTQQATGSTDFAASIGIVARRIREQLGLTLASVAQRAQISPGMLSRLETGRVSPSLETIVALAEVLGIRPALLLQEMAPSTYPMVRGSKWFGAEPSGATPITCWPHSVARKRYSNPS